MKSYHKQGPRIKTNGSLPRDGKRLPSPSRAIPNSPLLSPPASAELDAGDVDVDVGDGLDNDDDHGGCGYDREVKV